MILKTDKVLHFAASFVITALAALLLFGVAGLPKAAAIAIALAIAAVAGVGKELFDKYVRKTGFDKQDLMADGIGAVLAAICALGM